MKYLILILISLPLFSCENEPTTMIFHDYPDNILIGQTQNMNIVSENYLLSAKNGLLHLTQLDLDEDKRNDFEIGVEQIYGKDSVKHVRTYILSINDECLIYGKIVTDTLFINQIQVKMRDTLNHTFIDSAMYYSSSRINSNDLIVRINTNKFESVPLLSGNKLTRTDYFKKDTSFLQIENYLITSINIGTHSTDTIKTKKETYNNYQSFLPFDKEYYFGFKLKGSNTEKLGWVKLRIDKAYNILILERAIQE